LSLGFSNTFEIEIGASIGGDHLSDITRQKFQCIHEGRQRLRVGPTAGGGDPHRPRKQPGAIRSDRAVVPEVMLEGCAGEMALCGKEGGIVLEMVGWVGGSVAIGLFSSLAARSGVNIAECEQEWSSECIEGSWVKMRSLREWVNDRWC
jgi:hypothetical protein